VLEHVDDVDRVVLSTLRRKESVAAHLTWGYAAHYSNGALHGVNYGHPDWPSASHRIFVYD
jgi:hypothetical protein